MKQGSNEVEKTHGSAGRLVNIRPPTPPVFRMCGKQRTLSLINLEVWQTNKLRARFSDLWQMLDLAKRGPSARVARSGRASFVGCSTAEGRFWMLGGRRVWSSEWRLKDREKPQTENREAGGAGAS